MAAMCSHSGGVLPAGLTGRDLGSDLRCLTVLWVARCGLADLDGVGSLTNLRVRGPAALLLPLVWLLYNVPLPPQAPAHPVSPTRSSMRLSMRWNAASR